MPAVKPPHAPPDRRLEVLSWGIVRAPRPYLIGVLVIGGIFLTLGLLLHFWTPHEQETLPLIPGAQGPFRVRPSQTPEKPQHHVYADISIQGRCKTTESLLPPLEEPLFPEEAQMEGPDHLLPLAPAPKAPLKQTPPSPTTPPLNVQAPSINPKTSSKPPLSVPASKSASIDKLLANLDHRSVSTNP